MKNKFELKVLLLVLISIVCSCKNSPEDKVEKEFKNYVQTEIDDPSSLKEIVSITLTDTISYEKIKEGASMLFERFALTEEIDSIYKVQNSELYDKLVSISSRVNDTQRSRIYNLLSEAQSISYTEYDWINKYADEKENLELGIDTMLDRLVNLNLKQYVIKTRFEEKGDLKLKDFFALEDSASIRFFNHKPTFDDYSEEASKFYKVAIKYEELISTRSVIQEKKMDILKKIQNISNSIK